MAKGDGLGRTHICYHRNTPQERRLRIDITDQTFSIVCAANLAEGFGRKHTKDKLNFYYHSRGSLAETKSHLIYGRKVGYFDKKDFEDLLNFIDEIWKELNSLINSLTKKT